MSPNQLSPLVTRNNGNSFPALGVDILIAVGHSGYDSDKKIAAGVADIDVVVGGHSHSFLFSGDLYSHLQAILFYP